MRTLHFHRGLAEIIFFLSLPLTFAPLVLLRPPAPFYALPLAPVALAAMLHEFVGGTLVGLAAMLVVASVIALDPDPARRAVTLHESLPILVMYLAIGPFAGWLAGREREREARWVNQLAAVGEASREIAASLDLESTLRLVMEKAAETLPMEAGALFQYNEREDAFRVSVSHNLSPDHVARITFAFEDGVPGWVVNHRQTLVIFDASADPCVHPYVIEDGVRSVLATPMIAHNHVVGVLNLYGKTRKNMFDGSAVRLAEVYAAQAAVAVENARLVSELRRAAADLEARVERRTRLLRETQAQILRAEKLAVVGRLAASVAHEVNNPLQSMALQLELLTDQPISSAIRERLAILQKEIIRISGIVRRLLDFQRPKPGERAPHRIDQILQDVLLLAGKQLQNARVEVIREESESGLMVCVTADRLEQLFLNLVLNAIDAMPHGGKLQVTTSRSEGSVQVTFRDTGTGMDPGILEHLFEPFFTTKVGGSGLGRAISHEIVSQHGGTLEAASSPGDGATFTVTLPLYSRER